MKKTVLLAYLLACGALAFAQAPTVDKTSVAFTYQYNNANNTLTAKVTAKLTVTTTVMTVTYTSLPNGWLSVTPLSGSSPLALTVTANPTSLSPGIYNGSINVYNGASYTTVAVTLQITNPASSLLLSSPANATLPLTATASATAYTLSLPYTSGGTRPTAEIDVSTTGDIIPFNVTTAVTKAGTGTVANWLRVNSIGSLAATSTSGVASGSSIVPITVTLDQATLDTLDAISYTGTITIAPVKTGSSSSSSSTSYTVTVTLSVAPGTPILCVNSACTGVPVAIFPQGVPAFLASPTVTPVPPILTLYGDNFFNNGSWVFYQRTSSPDQSFHALPTTWVSRKILTATIPVVDLTPPQVSPPETWSILVVNGAPNTDPSNGNAQSQQATFSVADPSQPYIQAVVNAASYLPAATQLPVPLPAGTSLPYPAGASVVSPREIVSIFGQGLGPTTICSNTPTPLTDGQGNQIGTQYSKTLSCSNNTITIAVSFQIGQNQAYQAPLIMATYNQINAIVPFEISTNDDTSPVADGTPLTIQVSLTISGNQVSYSYTNAVKMAFDPGIFTFGGNGQGQAAVLNVDASSGAVTVNGATNAPKGSPIEIFMTGLGDLNPAAGLVDGQVASGAVWLADNSYRVLVGGQSAPIFYAGTAGTGVAGLVQINAIVPPNTASGSQSITVEIGPLANGVVTARRSQTGVTINVK